VPQRHTENIFLKGGRSWKKKGAVFKEGSSRKITSRREKTSPKKLTEERRQKEKKMGMSGA